MDERPRENKAEQQPTVFTLMRLADTLDRLRKQFEKVQLAKRAKGEERPPFNFYGPGGIGFTREREDRSTTVHIIYEEKEPLDASATAEENLARIVAAVSVVDYKKDKPDQKRNRLFVLSTARIAERLIETGADGIPTPEIWSDDIPDDQLQRFITEELEPLLDTTEKTATISDDPEGGPAPEMLKHQVRDKVMRLASHPLFMEGKDEDDPVREGVYELSGGRKVSVYFNQLGSEPSGFRQGIIAQVCWNVGDSVLADHPEGIQSIERTRLWADGFLEMEAMITGPDLTEEAIVKGGMTKGSEPRGQEGKTIYVKALLRRLAAIKPEEAIKNKL